MSSNNSLNQSYKPRKIAIVDDVYDMLLVYSLALEDSGHEVIFTATSGEEIVNKILAGDRTIDTIIMDYRMTGINGLEAVQIIKNQRPNIEIIMASADDSVMDNALKMGVSQFLIKPFSLSELVNSVSNRWCKFNLNVTYIQFTSD